MELCCHYANCYVICNTTGWIAGPSGLAIQGAFGLGLLEDWDVFESRSTLGYMSSFICVVLSCADRIFAMG